MRRNLILVLCACIGTVLGLALYIRLTRTQNLPYIDSFARDSVKEWKPFGGSWHIDGNAIVVIASEMGAKLTTGSQRWTDYDMSADVELLGHDGNFGIVVRVGDVSLGSEAIRGYLINLRSSDAGLEITRASKTFLSLAPVHLTGGVNANTWYRIHVIASGCRIAAEATNLATRQSAYIGFEDSPGMCIRSGGIALRTTATAAAWKHIQVRKAGSGGIEKLWAQVPAGSTASYPIREREYTAMREDYLAKVPSGEIHRPTFLGSFGPIGELDKVDVVQIDDLATRLWDTKEALHNRRFSGMQKDGDWLSAI